MIEISNNNRYNLLRSRLEQPLPGTEAHLKMAPIGRIKNVEIYKPNENTRVSSVLLLFYPEEGRLHFPMIVRPQNSGVHSGQIALPGGKKDEEDEDLIATALRETEEEIGVRVSRDQILGQLSHLYIPPSNFLVYPFVAAIHEKPKFIPSVHEVDELLSIDLDNFLSHHSPLEREIEARYMKAKVPCYELNGRVVWGATAMILSELQSIAHDLQ
jgi:8-oxo-dGTP pyrophosphatase MutT (NUDIX family)